MIILYFVDKSFFSELSNCLVPRTIVKRPCMAQAYARIVLGFWRDLKASGTASAEPLYVIETAARGGRDAHRFLLYFCSAFDAIRDPDHRICYVLATGSANSLPQWPELTQFVAQGRLDFAVFDPETDTQLNLQHRQIRLTLDALALPPVFITHHLQSVERLIELHAGALLILSAQLKGLVHIQGENGCAGWHETALAVQQVVEECNPNDMLLVEQALATVVASLGPDQLLAFLRLSHWNIRVFYLMLPHLDGVLAQLSGAAQQAWQAALGEVWRFHSPSDEDDDLAFDLAGLAAELNCWSMAINWFMQSLAHPNPAQRRGKNLVAIYRNLGIAWWQLAAYAEADAWLCKALELAPHDTEIRQQRTDLRSWRNRCQHILGADTLGMPTPPRLFASLLGPHQAQVLYCLQRDPVLCRLAGVECLQSAAHAQHWMRQEQREHKHLLAIFHTQYGLIGVAALEYSPLSLLPSGSQSGRFYYWIAPEHQQKGYGTQSLALLHQLAERKGILHIFSTVDQSNIASQRALAKLGYQCLPFELIDEQPGRRFHHFGASGGESDLHATLTHLLTELRSSTTLATTAC
jgi:RimJ/RimL family protein N-acetyltransferase